VARHKISLSGRISEPIGQVANLKPLTYDEFLHIARTTGYDAVCIRPLQCNISTPLDEMVEMARKTRAADLQVSMVTCDGDQPPNNVYAQNQKVRLPGTPLDMTPDMAAVPPIDGGILCTGRRSRSGAPTRSI